MTNPSWDLVVHYQNGVVTVTGEDPTEPACGTATITFQPGTGVRSVSDFQIVSPLPPPPDVSVTWSPSGNHMVVTDAEALTSAEGPVDVRYKVQVTDTSGLTHWSDPVRIEQPARPGL